MEVKQDVQEEILKAISEIGSSGATITQIASKVRFERHTLSKYLSFMQAHGLINYQAIGKAKVWLINNAPLKTVLHSLPEKKTFAEKILADIISTVPCGVCVVDRNYSIVFMNMSLVKNYGNLTDLIFYREILGMDNPLKLKSITEIIDLQKDTAELETEDRKGNLLRIKASKLVNPDKSLSVILMIEDITLTKRQQDEIYSQKKLLQAERDALNKAAIVAETDLNGKILFVNDKFVEISGHTRKELMGKTHKIINSGFHDKKFFKGLWDTLKAGKVWAGDIKNKRKDGSSYWTRSAMAPVKDRNGKPIKYIAVRFDISEFKK